MPQGEELRLVGLTKRFGPVTAVDGLTATVAPGAVTGFLGPNGAGKTTTLRMLLGLVSPTSGSATVGGVAYRDLKNPMRTVGAALEASSFHPGRTGANHLRVYARAAGLANSRVDEVLGVVGLADDADRKVGGYSLGMRQRLGLATALLGDPGVLVLDEPANGLDPEGIRWMRGLLQSLAREGRTVLVSSHLLAEVQQTADQLLVIARGRLVFAGRLDDLVDPDDERTVFDGPDRAALASAMGAAGIAFEVMRSGLTARQVEPVEVGRAAAAAGAVLSSLTRRGPSLEEVFLGLVDGTRVQRTREPADAPQPAILPPAPAEPAVDAPPPPAPARSFAVAATGVIDVVPVPATAAPRRTDAEADESRIDDLDESTAVVLDEDGEEVAEIVPADEPLAERDGGPADAGSIDSDTSPADSDNGPADTDASPADPDASQAEPKAGAEPPRTDADWLLAELSGEPSADTSYSAPAEPETADEEPPRAEDAAETREGRTVDTDAASAVPAGPRLWTWDDVGGRPR